MIVRVLVAGSLQQQPAQTHLPGAKIILNLSTKIRYNTRPKVITAGIFPGVELYRYDANIAFCRAVCILQGLRFRCWWFEAAHVAERSTVDAHIPATLEDTCDGTRRTTPLWDTACFFCCCCTCDSLT